jgi:hypothetical protein
LLLFHFDLLFSRIRHGVGVGNLDQIPPVQLSRVDHAQVLFQ